MTVALERDGIRGRAGDRFRIIVNCDLTTLAAALRIPLDTKLPVGLGSRAYLPNTGTHLDNDELSKICCDAGLQLLVDHDGAPLWLGTSQRLFTSDQRRALNHRANGCCEAPGCTNTRWLHARHVRIVCPKHHRELHQHRWSFNNSGRHLMWFDERGNRLGADHLPPVDHRPEPPDQLSPDAPRYTGGGGPLTSYALDMLLQMLLAA